MPSHQGVKESRYTPSYCWHTGQNWENWTKFLKQLFSDILWYIRAIISERRQTNEVSSTVASATCLEALSSHSTGSGNPITEAAQQHRPSKGLRPNHRVVDCSFSPSMLPGHKKRLFSSIPFTQFIMSNFQQKITRHRKYKRIDPTIWKDKEASA